MAHKPRILAFGRTTPKHGISPVHYYRIMMPFMALKNSSRRFEVDLLTQDGLETMMEIGGNRVEGMLLGRDIYYISRLYTRVGLTEFLNVIHEHGGIVIFDTDDDLTDEFREFGRGDEFIEALMAMDLVTVSTPFLADRMATHIGYRPPVLYNHIDFDWFASIAQQTRELIDGISIGFVGTSTHYNDWIAPVEALVKLAEKKNITITVAGYVPDYLEDVPNLHRLPPVRYEHYPAVVRQFDIVCCSLDPDDLFNKSKSAIKAIEAMSARRAVNGKWGGAIPVCTDMPVYRRVVNHMHNGMLISNNDWYEALLLLIEDKQLRTKLSLQGHKWAKKNRDISTGYKHWENLCKKVVSKGVDLYKR